MFYPASYLMRTANTKWHFPRAKLKLDVGDVVLDVDRSIFTKPRLLSAPDNKPVKAENQKTPHSLSEDQVGDCTKRGFSLGSWNRDETL